MSTSKNKKEINKPFLISTAILVALMLFIGVLFIVGIFVKA